MVYLGVRKSSFFEADGGAKVQMYHGRWPSDRQVRLVYRVRVPASIPIERIKGVYAGPPDGCVLLRQDRAYYSRVDVTKTHPSLDGLQMVEISGANYKQSTEFCAADLHSLSCTSSVCSLPMSVDSTVRGSLVRADPLSS